MENLFFGKSEKMKNHGGSRRLAEAQLSKNFVKNQKKLTNFRKIKKMEKWKIDFWKFATFPEKIKRKAPEKFKT